MATVRNLEDFLYHLTNKNLGSSLLSATVWDFHTSFYIFGKSVCYTKTLLLFKNPTETNHKILNQESSDIT
jgi:hypothetical protein